MSKKLYSILGVSENASDADIKLAYKRLAKEFHPDRNKDAHAEEKFKEINAAYDVLSDKEKKNKYDQYGDMMFSGGNTGGTHNYYQSHGGNFDFDDILRNMFGRSFSDGFGGDVGAGHFAQQLLDIHMRLRVPLSKAVNGGSVTVEIQNQNLKIQIPKGTNNGSKLRLAGKGKTAKNGSVGDLYITLLLISDSQHIDLVDNTILMETNIDLKTTIFGGFTDIDYFGENIRLKIPKNTKPGQKLRLSKGLNGGETLIALNVILPKAEDRPDLENIL